MKIQAMLSYMLIKRGFLGLVASAWGFMTGGSLLMTAITYKLASAGVSYFLVSLYQLVVLGLLCGAAWVIMDAEYKKKSIATARDFVAVFLLSLCFSAVIPVIFAVGAFVTWRDEIQRKTRSSSMTKPLSLNRVAFHRRNGLASFLQELMSRWFLKLAH